MSSSPVTGRKRTVTDGVGTRTFVYDEETLRPEHEIIDRAADFPGLVAGDDNLYDITVTRTYDEFGRPTGILTGLGEYGVTYGYESDTGRFSSVVPNVNGVSGTATYSYVPDSDLPHRLTSADGQLKTTYAYEPRRNLRTQVRNGHGTSLISQYDYEYDEIGRRSSVRNSGTAFAASAFSLYDYNDRSELTESERRLGTDITDTGMPVDPESRLYAYDPIGNRKSATEGTTDTGYTANNLNQYTALTGGISANPTYDDDGNMLSDTDRNYMWNAENRMILAEPENPAEGDKKGEYLYDYMGRRVRKKICVYAAGAWVTESERLFVYDGWNLIEEITVAGGGGFGDSGSDSGWSDSGWIRGRGVDSGSDQAEAPPFKGWHLKNRRFLALKLHFWGQKHHFKKLPPKNQFCLGDMEHRGRHGKGVLRHGDPVISSGLGPAASDRCGERAEDDLYGYEPHRNLRTQVRNGFNGFGTDGAGRRTPVVNTGTAFPSGDRFSLYDYNSRNGV